MFCLNDAAAGQPQMIWDPRLAETTNDFNTINHELNDANKPRRRNRQITSCLECRRRKLKCDRQSPCTTCTHSRRKCLYVAPATDARSQQRFFAIKDRLSTLEESFSHDVADKKILPQATVSVVSLSPEEHSIGGDWHDDESLESTPLATLDNVYDDNADYECMDLGVQLGRLRINERIGGWVRPKLVEELESTLHEMRRRNSTGRPSPPEEDQSLTSIRRKSYIGPGPDYIAPASSLCFPTMQYDTSPLDYLPSKRVADLLKARYLNAVNLIARAVHQPTFEKQYSMFWISIMSGIEPIPSIQAIIFAAMFSAAVSMNEAEVADLGTGKSILVDSLRTGTETALSKANFLRTTRLDTMQAFVMYLIPLVRSEVSRAHSALVGTAIRLAQCMGMHRDASNYSMSAVERQVRRIIWHELCFLDMRTCEATGPSPQIRRDEHDTQFPLNVDDQDLLKESTAPTQDKPGWTDMTLFRIRAEITEIRRGIWFDMIHVDRKEKSLTATLIKIQKICQSMQARYGAMIDKTVPAQHLGQRVLDIGMSGFYIQLLHRYLFNTVQPMPDRLRQLLLGHALKQMEEAIAMETRPEFTAWSWYRGAINQYHVAILLMREVCLHPLRHDAAKIWNCLDYVFDAPSSMLPTQKGEMLMTDLRDQMAKYHGMRKVKLTTQLEERVTSLGNAVAYSASREEMATSVMPQNIGIWSSSRASLWDNPGTNGTKPSHEPLFTTQEPWSQSSQHSSMNGHDGGGSIDGEVPLITMDDIDWAEWDQYFPFEQGVLPVSIEQIAT